MAHESLSTGLARPRIEPWIMDAAFLALLLLSFVGMQPFALRNPATDLEMGPYTVTGGGDWMRQAFYVLLICFIGAFAFLRRGLGMVRAVPPMLIVVLLWCLLSASWAAAPDVDGAARGALPSWSRFRRCFASTRSARIALSGSGGSCWRAC